jgi:mannose-6-phosphate isomerase-like protein (cupin superfamily)
MVKQRCPSRVVAIAAITAALGVAVLAVAASRPAGGEKAGLLKSRVVAWKDAPANKADWGEMRIYMRGETVGTKDVLTAVAVVEPGKAVHRSHRHAEEEYLIINEGSGTWQLGDKTLPARKSDILYAEPWVYHGLTNTGDKPLVFTVVRFSAKGVQPPPRPDSGKDEL